MYSNFLIMQLLNRWFLVVSCINSFWWVSQAVKVNESTLKTACINPWFYFIRRILITRLTICTDNLSSFVITSSYDMKNLATLQGNYTNTADIHWRRPHASSIFRLKCLWVPNPAAQSYLVIRREPLSIPSDVQKRHGPHEK